MALTFPNDGGPIGTSFVPSLFIFRTPLKKIILHTVWQASRVSVNLTKIYIQRKKLSTAMFFEMTGQVSRDY